MTGGGWLLLGTVPLVLSDWIVVSTQCLLLLALERGALSRGSGPPGYCARSSQQSWPSP